MCCHKKVKTHIHFSVSIEGKSRSVLLKKLLDVSFYFKRKRVMLKKILLLISMFYAVGIYGQGTIVFEDFPSALVPLSPASGGIRKVAIYLPDGYNSADSTTQYPVLYVLHRFFGSPSDLARFYKPILDELIENKEIAPMIVVMPDGSYVPYFNGFYTSATINFNVGAFVMDWEQYIAVELPSFIEATLSSKVKTGKKFRGISGFEVGGYGAVRLGMLYGDADPDAGVYQSISSLSGAGLDNQILLDQILNMFKSVFLLQSTPHTNPSIITTPPSLASLISKLIASPFNPDRINSFSQLPLFMMFGASAAWSPLLFTDNPGYDVFISLFSVFGRLNVPYNSDYEYELDIADAWNIHNPSLMLVDHVNSLRTQDIWLGYGDINRFFSTRLESAYAREPDTRRFSSALNTAGVPHTIQEFKNSEWTPGFVLPTTGCSIGLREQIKFHARVFES